MSPVPAAIHPPSTPWARLLLTAVALAAVVGVIVLAFLWPTVTASVKDLPVAVVGDTALTAPAEAAFEDRSPGTFAFHDVADRDEAVALIENRTVYGAIVLGRTPEVLVASAASPVVGQLLTGLAPALQANLTAAAAAQGIPLPGPILVPVTDVVPLAAADPRGASLGASSFPLVMGGMIGGISIAFAVVGAWRRVAALLAYAVVGGLTLAGILHGWFGALQGSYPVEAAATALALLSISGVIVGVVSLIGRAGIAVGPIVFLFFANPLSAAAQPVEFLAQPWGAIGQWFPPGAAATLLRDLSYFPDADTSFPWLVLGGWALLGLVLTVAGHFRTVSLGAQRASAASIAPVTSDQLVGSTI